MECCYKEVIPVWSAVIRRQSLYKRVLLYSHMLTYTSSCSHLCRVPAVKIGLSLQPFFYQSAWNVRAPQTV